MRYLVVSKKNKLWVELNNPLLFKIIKIMCKIINNLIKKIMNIEINGVKITLTQEQLQEIAKQTQQDIFTATTYSEVCKRLGEKELQLSDFGFTNNADTRKILSFVRIKQLERYFNQSWIPDWSNSSEDKYYLWYKVKNSSWVFGGVNYHNYCSGTAVGFYKTEKIAKHIQTYFNSEYLNVF